MEIGAWPERKDDKVFQKALEDLAADFRVQEIVAEFGAKLRLTPLFETKARRHPAEEAVGRMMHATAFAMADLDCRMVSMKEITAKREEIEKAVLKGLASPPSVERNSYLAGLADISALLAPESDLIVERRAPGSSKKNRFGEPLAGEEYNHARAVLARVRGLGRHIFGKAGDRVTDVFVEAVTGVSFSRDDARKRDRRRRRG
jgi:hypothetical protein